MGSWFVDPDVRRLDLSFGWIEVKRELPFGESERLRSQGLKLRMSSKDIGKGDEAASRDDNVSLDMSAYKLARMVAYITDWSARDKDDRPVKLTAAALAALRPNAADEIDTAIDRHLTEMQAEKENPTNVIDMSLQPV